MNARQTTDSTVRTAALGAALLIAQQVGAKTARDALFLESFDVSMLPRALVVAAVLTLLAVLGAGKLLARFGPGRVVPLALGGSAVLQVGAFLAFGLAPRAAAFGYYLLVAATGALLVSGFWSVVNESLDPNTARRRMGRIGTGATTGGLVGGLLALGIGHLAGSEAVLLLLAALTVGAALVVRKISPATARASEESTPLREGWSVLRRQAYVRDLAMLVVVITLGAACLDYVFKDAAQERFAGDGQSIDLVTFFGLFHSITALATLILQSTLARPLLQTAGLVRTLATLPAGLVAGSFAMLLVPLWPVAASARLLEGSLRSSLFRSSYEPLYTPLAPQQKRASKSLIDVGGERLGDAAGAVVVQLLLVALPTAVAARWLPSAVLAVAVASGLVALGIAHRLHRGYVAALEDSLLRRQVDLTPHETMDSTTRTMVLRARPEGLEDVARPAPSPSAPAGPRDRVVETVEKLRSRDATVVMRTLATTRPLSGELIGHVIPLLAWDAVAESAITALRATGERAIGPLVSALLDEDEDFSVRRRAPRAFPSIDDPLVVEALLRGLRVDRFEIRFQCARALDRLRVDADPTISRERVLSCVQREAEVPDAIWASHRLLDGRSPGPLFADSRAAQRAPVGLQHVFGLLGLVLPADAVRLCFEGLLTDDRQLRGTALEYLESVLPPAVRAALWPRLDIDVTRAKATPVDSEAALQSLMMTKMEIQRALEDTERS